MHVTITDPDTGKSDTVFQIQPDVAEALLAGLRNAVGIDPPRHTEDPAELLDVVAQTSRLIQHLEGLRELAIVKADTVSPHADRRALGIAAAMPPSRIYRILEKHGRPRNRAAAT